MTPKQANPCIEAATIKSLGALLIWLLVYTAAQYRPPAHSSLPLFVSGPSVWLTLVSVNSAK